MPLSRTLLSNIRIDYCCLSSFASVAVKNSMIKKKQLGEERKGLYQLTGFRPSLREAGQEFKAGVSRQEFKAGVRN